MTEKPDYKKIEELEKQLGMDDKKETTVLRKPQGVPVVKKNFKKVRAQDRPTKEYRGAEVDITVTSKDFTCLKIPGNVEHAVPMRLIDAKGRKLITDEIFSDALEIEGLSLSDRVTIVPNAMFGSIVGYIEAVRDDGCVKKTLDPNWKDRPEPVNFLPPLDVRVEFDSKTGGIEPPKPK